MSHLALKITTISLQLALCLLASQAPSHSAPAVKDQKAPSATAAAPAKTGAASNSSAKTKNMHRADFRVKGASCVSCLRRIAKTMRTQAGVIKGDVSIFPPYWAIVIYDGDQTSLDKIYESVKHEKVTFEDKEDRVVDGLPLIVIPKGMGQQQEPNAGQPGAAH